jgi:hypothetical protein
VKEKMTVRLLASTFCLSFLFCCQGFGRFWEVAENATKGGNQFIPILGDGSCRARRAGIR